HSYIVLTILFAILIAIFSVLNISPVEVHYFFWTFETPLIFVILFSVFMGVMITTTVGLIKMYKMQRQLKQLQADNKNMEQFIQDHCMTFDIDRYQLKATLKNHQKQDD